MKKLSLLLGLLLLLALAASPALAADTTAPAAKVVINGNSLATDVQPVIEGDQVYLPVRAVAEALGADVAWDAKTETVTVTKNAQVISIDLNQNLVLVNGKEFSLDVPVKMVDGRAMVLAPVFKEALGADAALDSATGNVNVTCKELVAGMSPEDLLVKANDALQKYDTYKFKGTLNMEARANDIPMAAKMTMDGSFKKPAESYFKMTMPMPENKSLNMEGYLKDGKIYQNVNGEGWKEAPLNIPSDLMNQLNSNDPAQSLQMLKDIGGIISAGTPETVNGNTYNVLKVTIDPVKYKEFTRKIVSGLSAGTKDQADTLKALDGVMSMMDINISYKLYVDSSSNIMNRMDISERINMNMPGAKGVTTVNGSINFYDFGLPVEMPKVTVAPTK